MPYRDAKLEQVSEAARELLHGAIDIHVHFAPDPYAERRLDARQLVEKAREAGIGGLVLKSHEYPTQPLAWLLDQEYEGIDVYGAIAKLREEIAELDGVLAASASAGERGTADEEVRDEIGDLLFAAVNVARLAGVPADDALADATTKFERRFGELLGLAGRLGMDPRAASLEELEALWQRVKADEG